MDVMAGDQEAISELKGGTCVLRIWSKQIGRPWACDIIMSHFNPVYIALECFL